MPMQRKPQKIEEVLEQTLEIIVHQQRFFGITLIKEYGDGIPGVVVDSNLMEQVFMNIILNALDAMAWFRVQLTIRTRRLDEFVEI